MASLARTMEQRQQRVSEMRRGTKGTEDDTLCAHSCTVVSRSLTSRVVCVGSRWSGRGRGRGRSCRVRARVPSFLTRLTCASRVGHSDRAGRRRRAAAARLRPACFSCSLPPLLPRSHTDTTSHLHRHHVRPPEARPGRPPRRHARDPEAQHHHRQRAARRRSVPPAACRQPT